MYSNNNILFIYLHAYGDIFPQIAIHHRHRSRSAIEERAQISLLVSSCSIIVGDLAGSATAEESS